LKGGSGRRVGPGRKDYGEDVQPRRRGGGVGGCRSRKRGISKRKHDRIKSWRGKVGGDQRNLGGKFRAEALVD